MQSIGVFTPLLSLHSLLTPDPGSGPECLTLLYLLRLTGMACMQEPHG